MFYCLTLFDLLQFVILPIVIVFLIISKSILRSSKNVVATTRQSYSLGIVFGHNQRRLPLQNATGTWVRGLTTQSTHERSAYLVVGQTLGPGDSLHSYSGTAQLINQYDGNLCLYQKGQHKWCTGNRTSPSFTIFQADGNLCQYAGTPENKGRLLWMSGPTQPGWRGKLGVLLTDTGILAIGMIYNHDLSTDDFDFDVLKTIIR